MRALIAPSPVLARSGSARPRSGCDSSRLGLFRAAGGQFALRLGAENAQNGGVDIGAFRGRTFGGRIFGGRMGCIVVIPPVIVVVIIVGRLFGRRLSSASSAASSGGFLDGFFGGFLGDGFVGFFRCLVDGDFRFGLWFGFGLWFPGLCGCGFGLLDLLYRGRCVLFRVRGLFDIIVPRVVRAAAGPVLGQIVGIGAAFRDQFRIRFVGLVAGKEFAGLVGQAMAGRAFLTATGSDPAESPPWNHVFPQLEHCTSLPDAGIIAASTSYCASQLGQIRRIKPTRPGISPLKSCLI